MAKTHNLPIRPFVFLDCKRKFPWYTTHGHPGPLRAKALPEITLSEIKKTSIETLSLQAHKCIKEALEKDPKGKAIEAIAVWKKRTT